MQQAYADKSFRVLPKTFLFKDDSVIPNSKYPLLLYQQVFAARDEEGAEWLEKRFEMNGWTNNWRWGVYSFHHYHSNTHEVLGVYRGNAVLKLGGEKGEVVRVTAGDIVVIPAGVGHKCLEHSKQFTVVGAYPDGLSPDLMRGEDGERPAADSNIANVPLPSSDPFSGKEGSMLSLWK